jgi:hypothetical protein
MLYGFELEGKITVNRQQLRAGGGIRSYGTKSASARS